MINTFKVSGADYRSSISSLFQKSWTNGTITINNIQIQTLWTDTGFIIFNFDHCSILLNINSFIMTVAAGSNSKYFLVHQVINTPPFNNTLNLNNFIPNGKVYIFYIDSNTIFNLTNSKFSLEAQVKIYGSNSAYYLNNNIMTKDMDIVVLSDSIQVYINNSIGIVLWGNVVAIKQATIFNLYVSNFTMAFDLKKKTYAAFQHTGSILNAQINFQIDNCILLAATCSSSCFILVGSSANVSVTNSQINNAYSIGGVGGAILLAGVGTFFMANNLTVNNSISPATGACFSANQMFNNTAIFTNCNFLNSQSWTSNNFWVYFGFLSMENCSLYNLSSPIAAFMFCVGSTIILNNMNFDLGITMNENFMDLTTSNLTVFNSNFSNLVGATGIFFSGKSSYFSFRKGNLKNISCSLSSIECSQCNISIDSFNFFNISQGNLMYLDSKQNNVSISNCNFQTFFLKSFSLFVMKNENRFIIISSNFDDIEIYLEGAFLQGNQNNNLTINNSIFNSINADSVGNINIFQSSILFLNNNSFMNSGSQTAGNFISATNAIVIIQNSIFENITFTNGGLFFLSSSFFLFKQSKVKNSSSQVMNNALNIMDSNVSIISSEFIQITIPIVTMINTIDDLNNRRFINSFFVNDSNFTQNRDNLNWMFSFQNGGNVSFSFITLLENVYYGIVNAKNTAILMQNLLFSNNIGNTYVYVSNNVLNLSNLKVNLSCFFVFGNAIKSNFLQGQGIYELILNNISIRSNNKTFLGSFISLENSAYCEINSIVFENNFHSSGTEYLFELSNMNKVILKNVNLTSNHLQFLKIQWCNVNLSFIQSLNNLIISFIFCQFSNFILSDSSFQGSNSLQSWNFFYNLTTFYFSQSNVFFSNLFFANIQNEINVTQIEIEIFNSPVLSLKNIQFFNDIFYSIHVINVTNIILNFCQFQIDKSQIKNGFGIIHIENFDNQNFFLTINNSNFINLSSLNGISPLNYESRNENKELTEISILNCYFANNFGLKGGAVSLKGITQVSIFNSFFDGNFAVETGLGGSIYSACTFPFLCNISFKSTKIQNCFANFLGGALFLENYTIPLMNDLVFENNTAKFSNEPQNSYNSSPFYINISHIKYVDIREEEYFFNEYHQPEIISIINNQNMQIEFKIYDSDNFLCNYLIDSNVLISTLNMSITLQETNVDVVKGIIEFTRFKIYGYFKEFYVIQMEVDGAFNLKKNFTFYIRECGLGEYFDEIFQTCLKCPYGTYSFDPPAILSINPFKQEEIKTCKSCPDNAECETFKIVPDVDFWKNSSLKTTLLVQCPISGSCIYQSIENFNYSVSCIIGHVGPLCTSCDVGYAREGFNSRCERCSFDINHFSLYFGKLFFIFIFVTYQIRKIMFRSLHFDDYSNISAVIVKILRDHFNQVFMIMSFCNIFEYDSNFLSSFKNVNDVVTGIAINFDCVNNEMNSFYFKILMIMLSPFTIHSCVSMFYFFIYVIKGFILKKIVTFKSYFKTMLVAFIIICDSQYTQLLISFLKLFECVQLDSNNDGVYLKYAPHVQCYTDLHFTYLFSIGIPSLVFWILGLPIIYFVVLYKLNNDSISKSHILQEIKGNESAKKHSEFHSIDELNRLNCDKSKKIIKLKKNIFKKSKSGIFEKEINSSMMMSFLFMDFKNDRYYWSSVIMIWKAILSLLVTFLFGEDAFIIVLTFYFVLISFYSYGNPYKNRSTQLLANVSFFCNGISIILAEFNHNYNDYHTSLVIANLLVHSIFLLMVLYMFLNEYGILVFSDIVLSILMTRRKNAKVQQMISSIQKFKKSKLLNSKQITKPESPFKPVKLNWQLKKPMK